MLLHHTGLHLNVLPLFSTRHPLGYLRSQGTLAGFSWKVPKKNKTTELLCLSVLLFEMIKNKNRKMRKCSRYQSLPLACQFVLPRCTSAYLSKVLVAGELIRVQHCALNGKPVILREMHQHKHVCHIVCAYPKEPYHSQESPWTGHRGIGGGLPHRWSYKANVVKQTSSPARWHRCVSWCATGKVF